MYIGTLQKYKYLFTIPHILWVHDIRGDVPILHEHYSYVMISWIKCTFRMSGINGLKPRGILRLEYPKWIVNIGTARIQIERVAERFFFTMNLKLCKSIYRIYLTTI